jgi:HNH endonuclease
MSSDPDRLVQYPLRWPAWLYEKVTETANARAMTVATWIREAALEKLERAGLNGNQVVHLDGDPRNNDPSNLELRESER